VLLDEAEVFLQERSLIDIHRNALVSGMYAETYFVRAILTATLVFLRVLEYYDGETIPLRPKSANAR
jgi:hypothetical protein